MDGFSFVEGPIDVEDYMRLRQAAGWQLLDYEKAEAALRNSLYSVCAASMAEVIGCARVVGDGAAYFYVQDVLVLPEFRSLGVAEGMMERVMKYLRSEASPGAFVGMLETGRLKGFYVEDGFTERIQEPQGMFRIWQEPDNGPLNGKGG